MDPTAGLDVLGNRQVCCPCWDLNPRRPACSLITALSTLCNLGSSVWILWRRKNLVVVMVAAEEDFQFYTRFVELPAAENFWSLLGT